MKSMFQRILVVGVALVVVSAPTSLAASPGSGSVQPTGLRDAICWWLPIACQA